MIKRQKQTFMYTEVGTGGAPWGVEGGGERERDNIPHFQNAIPMVKA